ncbi:MAG: 3'-5' exonuclease [Bacteroidia bacterium]|nr:3'-5' exonuclease [Bacteroidia bacterium]MDW8302328.1 3'-5' exonuclease [Bacteroidia bacterium]
MIDKIDIEKVLFMDSETVPMTEKYENLPERFQKLWDKKTKNKRGEQSPEQYFEEQGGVLAEFGKIVCISVGIVKKNQQSGELELNLYSFYNEEEKKLLETFKKALDHRWSIGKVSYICAHNGKEFDFPYICRRMLINRIGIPLPFQIQGKKPWEITHLLDTMELWKFGDNKNFTSLDLLAAVFDIPTPKSEMDGSQVKGVYYQDKDLEKIATYCEKDVTTLVQVFLALRGENPIAEQNIIRHTKVNQTTS